MSYYIQDNMNPGGFKEYPSTDAQRIFSNDVEEDKRMTDMFTRAVRRLEENIADLEKMMLEGDEMEKENKKMWKKFNQ